MMVRLVRAFAVLFCCAPGVLCAQAPADSSGASAGEELKIMREMLEQQSKQLDVLAQEVARLNLLLEGKTPAPGVLTPAEASGTASTTAPAQNSVPDTAPKAVAVEAGPSSGAEVHIVAKGETLTAIAKAYKIRVSDLLKVNKIADVRKLQIGQAITLPPGTKLQESPSPAPKP